MFAALTELDAILSRRTLCTIERWQTLLNDSATHIPQRPDTSTADVSCQRPIAPASRQTTIVLTVDGLLEPAASTPTPSRGGRQDAPRLRQTRFKEKALMPIPKARSFGTVSSAAPRNCGCSGNNRSRAMK